VAAVSPKANTDAEAAAPTECLACRGTGRLISGLGGTPHEVACPWCEGTGTRVPGIDAQAHPAEHAGEAPAAEESDPSGSASAAPAVP
jgi:DnaJ-class molecular chaperone